MISTKFNGYVVEYNNEYEDALPVICINIDVLFGKGAAFYVKLNIDVILAKLKKYSVILYQNSPTKAEKLIGDTTEAKKIMAFVDRGLKFKMIFLDKLLASPYPKVFKDYNCKLVVGHPGHAFLSYPQDRSKEYFDEFSDLNLAINLGVDFRTINDLQEDRAVIGFINKTPFKPGEYFDYKLQNYYKYEPYIEIYQRDKIENIYIAGPPSFGKTQLAKYIAKAWNYKYCDFVPTESNVSHIVDINPRSASDFKNADRIFSIYEPELTEESIKLISRHLLLLMKRFHINAGEKLQYNTHEIDKYFEIKEALRYPKSVSVTYFDYIPYQFFFKKYKNLEKLFSLYN